MPDVSELAINDTASTPSRPIQQFDNAGSQPAHFFSSYHGGIDEGMVFLVRHASDGTFIWVNTMSVTSQEELEFQQQKDAFGDISPIILAQFHGHFIVSHNGEILDHDQDLPTLTARFFSQHGDMPVFITKIGEELEDRFDTPFFE